MLVFSARHASVELDDVAELACEWTAARELHPNVKVVIELQEIEARYRRSGNVGLKFLCFEQPFARARLPGFHEFVDNALGFAEDTEVRRLIKVGARCDAGSADDHRFSPGMAEVDNVERVALLRQHASGQDQIGPVDVVRRSDQVRGSKAATVIKPSGDAGCLAPNTSAVRLSLKTCLRRTEDRVKSALQDFPVDTLSTCPPIHDRHRRFTSQTAG